MAENILLLNSKDAKTFFIKTDSYFSGERSEERRVGKECRL